MERIFGYNTGIVAGQVPTKLKHHKRTVAEQFEVFRKDYVATGRPLRSIEFENGKVDWEKKPTAFTEASLRNNFRLVRCHHRLRTQPAYTS